MAVSGTSNPPAIAATGAAAMPRRMVLRVVSMTPYHKPECQISLRVMRWNYRTFSGS